MPLECKVHSKTPKLMLMVHGYKTLTHGDITNFSTFFDKYLYGDESFKVFFDLRTAETPPTSVISALSKYMISCEKVSANRVIASAILVNDTIKNILNLLFTFQKPASPTKITSNIETACEFLNEN